MARQAAQSLQTALNMQRVALQKRLPQALVCIADGTVNCPKMKEGPDPFPPAGHENASRRPLLVRCPLALFFFSLGPMGDSSSSLLRPGQWKLLRAVDVPPTIKVLAGATVISDLHGGGPALKLTRVVADRLGSLLADGRTHFFLATVAPAT